MVRITEPKVLAPEPFLLRWSSGKARSSCPGHTAVAWQAALVLRSKWLRADWMQSVQLTQQAARISSDCRGSFWWPSRYTHV